MEENVQITQGLTKGSLNPAPFIQFAIWFDQAKEAGLFQYNSMALATATPEGRPSVRMVLLEGFDEKGFVFYTSYESRKGKELAQNPWAACTFWWGPMFRQVRIEGEVTKLSGAECDAYFSGRPRQHQLESWSSSQSQVIKNHRELERRLLEMKVRYGDGPIPRPPDFGGYRLIPETVEFWQARPDWLHDWLRYSRQEDGNWLIERLSP